MNNSRHHRNKLLRSNGAGRRRMRRGSIYLLTLGLALVLTLMGLATVTAVRIGGRAMSDSRDWSEAQSMAYSAADHAMLQIARNSNWRTLYSGQTVQKTLGRGTFTWQLADESDGDLAGGAADPFVILAGGAVGQAGYCLRINMAMPAAVSGLGVSTSLTVNNSTIDSYNSTSGDYGGSNVGSQAVLGTNSSTAGAISLASNAVVKGSLNVGPGGNPALVISKDAGSTITGSTGVLDQFIAMPSVSAPANLGPNTGNVSYQGNHDDTLSQNLHVNDFTVKSNAALFISGDVTVWAEGNVSITNKSGIEVLPGSSLTIYVQGSTTISKRAVVDGLNLSRLKIIALGNSPIQLNGASLEGVIIAPNAAVQMSNGAQLYGSATAKSLSLAGGAGLHEDKRITSLVDRVVLPGGSSAPAPVAWGRIVQ